MFYTDWNTCTFSGLHCLCCFQTRLLLYVSREMSVGVQNGHGDSVITMRQILCCAYMLVHCHGDSSDFQLYPSARQYTSAVQRYAGAELNKTNWGDECQGPWPPSRGQDLSEQHFYQRYILIRLETQVTAISLANS